MSPAGSIESFVAAFEGGADSVYLGLKKFNARKPAKNFSVFQLKKAIEFAHKNDKQIYVTLNIDLKSNELEEAVSILALVEYLKIDGVIIKDPAIFFVIKKFFPSINIHFSTQNAIESSLAVDYLQKNGVKRVVLARELNLAEISQCCKSNVQCEIFTEGSMCFSISGRCFMSSWVGGRSGNRGACTAPCRIKWKTNGKEGSFFSMKDLSLVTNLSPIIDAGVNSLKIEGRLKNAMWVKTVTSIYRVALDNLSNQEKLSELKESLKKYSARENWTGHIYSHSNLIGKNEEWTNYEKSDNKPTDLSIFAENNKVIFTKNENKIDIKIIVNENEDFTSLEIPPPPKKAKVMSFATINSYFGKEINEKQFSVELNDLKELEVQSGFLNKIFDEVLPKIKKLIDKDEKYPEVKDEILQFIKSEKQDIKRKKILGDAPNTIIIFSSQIDHFLRKIDSISEIMVYINSKIEYSTIKKLAQIYKVIIALPAVLFENEAIIIKKDVLDLYNNGITNFCANSYTGIEILSKIKCNKHLGFEFPVLNHIAAKYFYEEGYKSVYASPESDVSVLKSLSSFCEKQINCFVFGKLPLFISRVEESDFKEKNIFSDKYTEIEVHNYKGANYFISNKIFSLVGDEFKKEQIYFDNLTADLRFFAKPTEILSKIAKKEFNKTNTESFNFYRKLV